MPDRLTGRVLLATMMLAACTVQGPVETSHGEAQAGDACGLPYGWDAVAATGARFVIFGESHGTAQAPAFFERTACALAKRGERVLVGVEHSAVHDDAFQKAWARDPADFRAALTAQGWAGRQDGVASEAMLAMLTRLHGLKSAGYAIDIVAFKGARDAVQAARHAHLPAQGGHEAAQAENIRLAADARPYDLVLVLVGALHAMDEAVDMGSGAFLPMAGVLKETERAVSLTMTHAGGTQFACILPPDLSLAPGQRVTDDMVQCASHDAGKPTGRGDAQFVALEPDTPDGYDGTFHVGPVTASPPALPARETKD